MYTLPSAEDLIEGVMISLQRDVMPELQSQKAQVAVLMMQALLQSARQAIPVQQQIMAAEHNEMTAALRDIAAIIADSAGPEATRIRDRAKTLGQRDDLPAIPAYEELATAYRQLSQSLVDTLDDLDILVREGNTAAEAALTRLRQHLGPRTAREFGTYVVGAGMAGRG
jgi:soluble cytochrome b562